MEIFSSVLLLHKVLVLYMNSALNMGTPNIFKSKKKKKSTHGATCQLRKVVEKVI